MSDASQGPGWWQASDLKWYPPDQQPGPEPDPTAWGPAPEATPPPTWGGDQQSGPYGGAPPGGAPYGGDPYGGAPYGGAPYGGDPYGGAPYGGAPYGGPPAPYGGGVPGYQAYGAYPAGMNVHGTPSGKPSVNGMATASLVLGIISLVLCWCWVLGLPLGLIGVSVGGVALSRISKGTADPGPRGQALAGVICGGIALVVGLGFLVLIMSS